MSVINFFRQSFSNASSRTHGSTFPLSRSLPAIPAAQGLDRQANPTGIELGLLAATWLLLGTPALLHAAERVDYLQDVWPILQSHCVGCHSNDAPEGGLNMQDFEAFRQGGDHGLAFTAGVPDSSRLYLMAAGKQQPVMPPDGEEPLGEEQLAVLAAWIEQGAPGPAGDMSRIPLRVPRIATQSDVQPITAITLLGTPQRIAVARFGQIEIVDSVTLQAVENWPLAAFKINALAVHPGGNMLLVAGGTAGLRGRLVLLDATTGEELLTMHGHRDAVTAAQFSPDGSKIVTGSYDRQWIIWDTTTGEPLLSRQGHNGAIFHVAYANNGQLIATASADETVKLWETESGRRMDTLPQPQAEVMSVHFTPDDAFLVAASSDSRFRVWQVVSWDKAKINPLRVTRFADESAITHASLSPAGDYYVTISEAAKLNVFRTHDWNPSGVTETLPDNASGIQISASEDQLLAHVSLLNGELVSIPLGEKQPEPIGTEAPQAESIYLDLDPGQEVEREAFLSRLESRRERDGPHWAPRGLVVSGIIRRDEEGLGEFHRYPFQVHRGEVWVIETDAQSLQSPLDTIVEILDEPSQQPVTAVRLQAIRDSYFTFRGKDSFQSGDFRLFAWEEMELDEYLYASGEVTKLWMYPRGPDSGFLVYPGNGSRWTYFGTSAVAHGLGEPAYIVRVLKPGEAPLANGLPVLDIPFANDDDPQRRKGTDSQVIFTAPNDANYIAQVRDVRGHGGDDFRYRLTIRPANPGFDARVVPSKGPIFPGAGREIDLQIDRRDGFQGPVHFRFSGLPAGVHITSPVEIESGQNQAVATVWADADLDVEGLSEPFELFATATAEIAGRRREQLVVSEQKLSLGQQPPLTLTLEPLSEAPHNGQTWTLQIRPGQTVQARVVAQRHSHKGEISLGKETAGRNTAHGVFVDNIGLNGLLITADSDERDFFVTAAPKAEPGIRPFFLTASVAGGITSPPIMLEVVTP